MTDTIQGALYGVAGAAGLAAITATINHLIGRGRDSQQMKTLTEEVASMRVEMANKASKEDLARVEREAREAMTTGIRVETLCKAMKESFDSADRRMALFEIETGKRLDRMMELLQK